MLCSNKAKPKHFPHPKKKKKKRKRKKIYFQVTIITNGLKKKHKGYITNEVEEMVYLFFAF